MPLPPLKSALLLCGLACCAAAAARANDNPINVVVTVDFNPHLKFTLPAPGHPVYFLPVVRGFGVLDAGLDITQQEIGPPSKQGAERMIAYALAQEGYLPATQSCPPAIILIFQWGYLGKMTTSLGSVPTPYTHQIGGYGGNGAQGISQLLNSGYIPTNRGITNSDDLEHMVFGATTSLTALTNHPNTHLQALIDESRKDRYYYLVSAYDYKGVTERRDFRYVWVARISTSVWGHTLRGVMPTLIAVGTPKFGQHLDGPQLTSTPIVPPGYVTIGQAILKGQSAPGR